MQQDEPRAHHVVPRDPGEPPVRAQHSRPAQHAPDESHYPETAAEEGVREADHDKLYEAQKEEGEANRK